MLLKWLTLIPITYLVVSLGAYFLGQRLAFYPQKTYDDDPNIIQLKSEDGNTIAARFYKNPQSKYVFLFSHGNAEDLGMIDSRMQNFVRHGYSIFAYDYPGYGLSTGSPNEASVNKGLNAAYRYLTEKLKISPDRIILYGFSIGAGATLELAMHQAYGGIILQGAFISAYRVITQVPLLPWGDFFINIDKLPKINKPLLHFHGRADCIINFFHATRLDNVAPEPKMHLWVSEAGHNDFIEVAGDRYWNTLDNYIQRIDPGPEKSL